ncbi:MAG: ribosome biogenesis GTPase Der [Deltaproteobacteria bacterium]|nr:ribosome biogenesis GTPase Der [Deltaproteobacteria bacterium]
MRALVAIIGRPNVGKSTLFNRMVGFSKAIVDDAPGITRDRNYGDTELAGRPVTLVDTGGFEPEAEEGAMMAMVREQTLMAIEEADLIVLVLDARHGLHADDRELVDLLRRSNRPFLVVINKTDGLNPETALVDFYSLGVEPILPISAAHGHGFRDLAEEIAARLPEQAEEIPEEELTKIAVIGRPNVGKSSLLNKLLGEERSLVTDVPGTTRDPVDALVVHQDKRYLFIDTAGIRRKGRVAAKVEKYSVVRALRCLDRCDIAILVMDALEGITDQDAHIAGYAFERGRGLILAINKWDAVKDKGPILKRLEQLFDLKLGFLSYVPRLMISALTGYRVEKIFGLVDRVSKQYQARFSTAQVNRVVTQAVVDHPPPYVGRGRLKFYYATQARTKPPTFVLFANRPDEVHFSYQRFLANTFRKAFDLDLVPVKVVIRPHHKEQ